MHQLSNDPAQTDRSAAARTVDLLVLIPAVVLVIAGVGKSVNPTSTFEAFHALLGLGGRGVALMTGLLVLVELVLAAWLFSGRGRRPAIASAGLFLAVVSAALVVFAVQGREVPCGCGLPLRRMTPAAEYAFGLARNGLLLALLLAAWRCEGGRVLPQEESWT